jgi:uncharacterized repeat protein (TIGR01451 family)
MSVRAVKAVLALALAIALFVAAPATGFFPLSFLTASGALGRSHEEITRRAIEAVDQELFGVDELTLPMRLALFHIVVSNASVDLDQSANRHFDSEDFKGGQAWITDKRAKIISSLEEENTFSARTALGQALHTIQDFYSHSNWIELHGEVVNADVGRPGSTVGPAAGRNDDTCRDCETSLIPLCNDCSGNVTTSLLTSGYYSNPNKPAGVAKCDHGGPFDSTATDPVLSFKFGISKDASDCTFSPRYDLHAQAAETAETATRQFIHGLEEDLTPRQMGLLLGGGPTLAIAIDTTSSMTPIIEQVKVEAISIIDASIGTPEQPARYVLAPFNDPSTGPLTVTTDPEVIKAAIRALRATGGGDCPELAYTGMLQAMGAMDPGGHLFVFTDASARDASLAGEVVSLALATRTQIEALRFGSCGAGAAPDPGQSPFRFTRAGWRSLAAMSGDFREVAEASGGQVFDLLVSEAGDITNLAELTARSNSVEIASLSTTLTGTPVVWSLPADTTLERLTFSVSGDPEATIRRPDGSAVLAGDAGVEFVELETGRILAVTSPTPGAWNVEVSGNGPVSLEVSGESPLDLDAFQFVKPGGRPGHDGWYPITGLPVEGNHQVAAALVGDFQTVAFELRRKNGTVLQGFSLAHGFGQSTSEFAGEITLPAEPFLIYAVGTDAEGMPFQRLLPGAASRQSVSIQQVSGPSELRPGQAAALVFRVTNFGEAGDFTVSVSDDKGYVSTASPASFHLTGEASLDVTVQLVVPADAPLGSSDTVTAVVRKEADPQVTNYAVATSLIVGGEADVTLAKTVSATGPVPLGSEIVYTLTLSNAGLGAATGVTVTDALPSQVELVEVEAPCSATAGPPGTVTWNVGTLAPEETVSCALAVRVVGAGSIVNTATATLSEPDSVPANNTASVTVSGGSVMDVPTLSSFGLALMIGALALGGALLVRRSRRGSAT